MSVILNYIEGFARFNKGNQRNFSMMSYGLLKETKYLLHFSLMEGFINENQYKKGMELADEIGALLWTEIKNIKDSK